MSIQNLPVSIAGSKVPFDETLISRLRRGMSLQINYNGTIMRRGIVFLEPSSSPQFMWWQGKTRFVTGEVPVCHSLLHDIDEIRWPSLTLEPVPQFQEWFSKLPFAMKVLLGHPTRGKQRAQQPLKPGRLPPTTTPAPQISPTTTANWPLEYEIDSQPGDVPSFAQPLQSKTRKVRSDKNVRRGKNTGEGSLAMQEEPHTTDVVNQTPPAPAHQVLPSGSLQMEVVEKLPPPPAVPFLSVENPTVDYLLRVIKAIKDVPGAPGM